MAYNRLYRYVRYGDLYSTWRLILSSTAMEWEDTGNVKDKKTLLTLNHILILIHGLNSVRFLTTLLCKGHAYDFAFGHTDHSAGMVTTALAVVHCIASILGLTVRIINSQSLRHGKCFVLRTIQDIVNESDVQVREKGIRFTRIVTWTAVVSWITTILCTIGVFTTVFWLNIRFPGREKHDLWWTVWWLIDLMSGFVFDTDFFLCITCWILVTHNYSSKLRQLIRKINLLGTSRETVFCDFSACFKDVKMSYRELIEHAKVMQDSSPKVLTIIMLCMTRVTSTFFVLISSETRDPAAIHMLVGVFFPILCTLWLLWMTGGVTSLVNTLHTRTASTVARLANDRDFRLTSEEQKFFLLVLKSSGSDPSLLPLHTITGQKFTRLAFFTTTMVSVTQFMLFSSVFSSILRK